MTNDVDLSAYLPVLVLTVLAVGMAFSIILLSHLFGPVKRDRVKSQPYESGMPSLGGGRLRLSIEYFLMAIIFLAFDVEVTFLFPWALIYGRSLELGSFILLEMFFFFIVLLAGYFYGWREGAYEWDSNPEADRLG
ncbi:MAG: NADH-quinone oxidoreductase subunit A [Planctomycetes bacterium]|nr:NADH-quinone oxidoreductase subunit A [Planctomycetota bacterium]